MFGIDVSQYQEDIDWNKLKGKIDFAILRLGWIGNKNNHTLDTKFERNYSETKRLGIATGVYVYNYCNNEETIKQGAKWALERLKNKSLELPVYIDMEDETITNLGKNKLTNLCVAFNTVIEGSGLWAGVYANRNWYDNYLNKEEIRLKYTTWIANYGLTGKDQYKGVYDMWQNSDTARIDGIDGRVDTNYLCRNLIGEIGKVTPKPEEGDEKMKIYQNGSTRENVYSDTNLSTKIGSLNPRERCDCYGIFNNRAVVRYKIDGSGNNYKIGFCKWLGEVKVQ